MKKLSTLLFTPLLAFTLSVTVPALKAQDTGGCKAIKSTQPPAGKKAVKTKARKAGKKGGKKVSPEDAASKDAAKKQ